MSKAIATLCAGARAGAGYNDEDDTLYTTTRHPNSNKYQPTGNATVIDADVARAIDDLNIPARTRTRQRIREAAAPTASMNQYPVPARQPRRRNTSDEYTLQPQPYQRERRQWPPLVWVVLTLLAIALLWEVTTVGASWWTATFSDPATYGPVHGQVITAVLGGGDSEARPSKIYSVNDGGRVLIIKLTGDDPTHSQIIPGPNLAALNLPDPTGAEIQIEAGDYNGDGHQDIKVTILGSFFDAPLHRYQQHYILDGDGKGDLKQQVGGQ